MAWVSGKRRVARVSDPRVLLVAERAEARCGLRVRMCVMPDFLLRRRWWHVRGRRWLSVRLLLLRRRCQRVIGRCWLCLRIALQLPNLPW